MRSIATDSNPSVTLAVAIEYAGGGADNATAGDGARRSRAIVYVYEGEVSAFLPSAGDRVSALQWNIQGRFPVRACKTAADGQTVTSDPVMSMCWIEDTSGAGSSMLSRNVQALLVGTRSCCVAYVYHRQFNRWGAAPEIVDVPVERQHGCSCVAWAPGSMERSTGPTSTSVMAAAVNGKEVLLLNIGRHEGETCANENEGGRVVARLEHDDEVEAIAWNVIGTVLATTDSAGNTKLWGPNLLSEWEERQSM